LCFLHNICGHFSAGGAGGAVVVLQRGSWHTQGFFGRSVVCSHRLLLCFSRFLFLFLILEWILSLGVFFLFYGDRSSCLHARVSRHEGLAKLGRELFRNRSCCDQEVLHSIFVDVVVSPLLMLERLCDNFPPWRIDTSDCSL
jgi:hypothetical protein